MFKKIKIVLAMATLCISPWVQAADSVTIQEFADFQCKYCVRGDNVMKEVVKNYGSKVKLVFRNLPLPSHPQALAAAKAYSAISLQCSTLAHSFKTALFANQDKFNAEGEPYLYQLAETLGVNIQQMKSDMAGDAVSKIIEEDQKLADSFGFKATPSFMIGSEPVTGALPYDEIKKVIDRQLDQ